METTKGWTAEWRIPPQYVFVFKLNKHKGKLKERFTEGYKDVSNLQNFHIFNRAYSFQRLKKTNAQRAI